MGGTPPNLDTIETPRLIGERMRREYLPDMCALHSDPRVMATLGGVRSDTDSKLMIKRMVTHWDQHAFGLWMFYAKTDRRFIGRGGLQKTHVGGNDEVELAYAIVADAWRQGFACELGRESLRLGFEGLGLPDIVCFTLHDNIGSQRVMQKLGFTYERDITYAELPHLLYRLKADEFAREQKH